MYARMCHVAVCFYIILVLNYFKPLTYLHMCMYTHIFIYNEKKTCNCNNAVPASCNANEKYG